VHDAGDWGSLDAVSAQVAAAACAVAAELGLRGAAACLALSCDEHVAQLNATYRGKPAPTNVLSFPAPGNATTNDADARFLGDIVLAGETLSREAKDLGLAFAHHLQHLVVHGLLHLLGYDHETETGAREMEALEVRILGRLGIADPYEAAGDPCSSRHQTDTAKS